MFRKKLLVLKSRDIKVATMINSIHGITTQVAKEREANDFEKLKVIWGYNKNIRGVDLANDH